MRRRPPPATDVLHAAVRRMVASRRDDALARQSPNTSAFRGAESVPPLACATPPRVARVVVPTVGHRSGRLFQ
jgi:hypothetical protein